MKSTIGKIIICILVVACLVTSVACDTHSYIRHTLRNELDLKFSRAKIDGHLIYQSEKNWLNDGITIYEFTVRESAELVEQMDSLPMDVTTLDRLQADWGEYAVEQRDIVTNLEKGSWLYKDLTKDKSSSDESPRDYILVVYDEETDTFYLFESHM